MDESTHRRLSRGLEDDALGAVVTALIHDGRTVGQLRRPDREPDLHPHLVRRPDGYAEVDGEPTAFDVTLFTTDAAQMRTIARVEEIKAIATPLVGPIAPRQLIAIIVSFRLGDTGLLQMRSTMRRSIAERLAAEIKDALASGRLRRGGPDVYLDEIHPSLKFTVGAPISPSTAVMWGLGPSGPRPAEAVRPWLLATIQKKARQHEGWGRGVLVVVALWNEDDKELSEGIARHARDGGEMPWWRVYLVGFARDSAELVWPAPTGAPQPHPPADAAAGGAGDGVLPRSA